MTFTLDARIGERHFDVALTVGFGETVAILGPNGAGKSTLLNLIAGLLVPDSGRAELERKVLFDVGRTSSRITPPHARGVSLLAQDPLLFPHLSVLENVAFGPRSAGSRTADARATARTWLTELDGLELADRKPGQLSGGEAQRVAVARALASNPKLLLLDEPLSALDVSVAPSIRRMLRRVLKNRTSILVTHDILDAFTLADRVIVLENGVIVEQGPTRDVLERPRSLFAAGLAALNLLTGIRTTGGFSFHGATIRVDSESVISPGTPVAAVVRPSEVAVVVAPPEASRRNVLRGVIEDLEPRGDLVRVRSERISADLTPARVAHLDLAVGDTVWFTFAADDVVVYPL